jgi:hypothetical protein
MRLGANINGLLLAEGWLLVAGRDGSVVTINPDKMDDDDDEPGRPQVAPSHRTLRRPWNALRRGGWAQPDGGTIFPLDQFYNRFATPGLARRIWSRDPSLHLQGDIADELAWPGVQAMLKLGLASIERTPEGTFLCLEEVPRRSPSIRTGSSQAGTVLPLAPETARAVAIGKNCWPVQQ